MTSRARVTPVGPDLYDYQFGASGRWHGKLGHMRGLSGHRVPSGEVADVLEYALDIAIAVLEKRKYAATDKPRPARRPKPGSRNVPNDVRRQVRERDGDQCAFVSDTGQRCSARGRLEFDPILEVARGGAATVDNDEARRAATIARRFRMRRSRSGCDSHSDPRTCELPTTARPDTHKAQRPPRDQRL